MYNLFIDSFNVFFYKKWANPGVFGFFSFLKNKFYTKI